MALNAIIKHILLGLSFCRHFDRIFINMLRALAQTVLSLFPANSSALVYHMMSENFFLCAAWHTERLPQKQIKQNADIRETTEGKWHIFWSTKSSCYRQWFSIWWSQILFERLNEYSWITAKQNKIKKIVDACHCPSPSFRFSYFEIKL